MTLRTGEVYFFQQSNRVLIPETISLFGLSISFYGIFLVLAAVAGIFVAVKEARKKGCDVEWNLTLITVTIVSAVLGARLFFVLFHWQVFLEEPIALLNVRGGGLSYFGALLGAWIAVKQYCRRKKTDYLPSADLLALGAAAAAPLVWLGCAMIKEPIGRYYNGIFSVRIGANYIPDGMETEVVNRLLSRAGIIGEESYLSVHPVALYGAVFSIVLFVALFVLNRIVKQKGVVFTYYLLLNSVMAVVLEQFRAEHAYIWGTKIPVNIIVAGVLVLVIVLGWVKQFYKQRTSTMKHL